MPYPIAWYITWTTYGTWLHGDARGSFRDKTYIPPDPELEAANRSEMTGEVVYLTPQQRAIVDAAIAKDCQAHGWELHACNVRTNHVHVVVSAARDGKLVRGRSKAIAAKALSDHAGLPLAADDNGRKRWWTEKGNVIPIEDDKSLEAIIVYVRDLQ